MAYRTDDGRVFDNQSEAQTHANNLESERASMSAASRAASLDTSSLYSESLNSVKTGDWDFILSKSDRIIAWKYPDVNLMLAIAYANKGNLENAAMHASAGDSLDVNAVNQTTSDLYKRAKNDIKKLWEKKNGRTMTDADYNYLRKNAFINEYEKTIKDFLSRNSDINDCVKLWERNSGRKMTIEDQIRIYGQPFPVGSLSSDSDTSSNSDSTSVIVKIIGAVIGAVIGGILLKFLPSWIAIIGGGVAGWFLGATLKKKFIVIGIITVVVLLAGQQIVGFIGGKLASSETSTEQTTEE
jgi:hypothetical protein